MYQVKGKLKDGTRFSFRTKADQMGEAATSFIAVLAKQANTSPVDRVTFIAREEKDELKFQNGDLKPKKPGAKNPAAAAAKK